MSEINKGMLDNTDPKKSDYQYDVGGNNDIRLPRNDCGGVYKLAVGDDRAIGSQYVAKTMEGLLMALSAAGNPANTCTLGIANPDNLTYIPGYDTLIIGEDTGTDHQNDALWAYNVASKEFTRIETTPYGSETTSVYWYPNIGGFGYLMSVVQHPYGEEDGSDTPPKDHYVIGSGADRAYSGCIGLFPAMDSNRPHGTSHGWKPGKNF
jgi:hypothetical protein